MPVQRRAYLVGNAAGPPRQHGCSRTLFGMFRRIAGGLASAGLALRWLLLRRPAFGACSSMLIAIAADHIPGPPGGRSMACRAIGHRAPRTPKKLYQGPRSPRIAAVSAAKRYSRNRSSRRLRAYAPPRHGQPMVPVGSSAGPSNVAASGAPLSGRTGLGDDRPYPCSASSITTEGDQLVGVSLRARIRQPRLAGAAIAPVAAGPSPARSRQIGARAIAAPMSSPAHRCAPD